MAARQDISDSLDVLAQTPGTMLWRGSEFWQAIEPSDTPGYVLTSAGLVAPPSWEAPSGGGGSVNMLSAAEFAELALPGVGDITGMTVSFTLGLPQTVSLNFTAIYFRTGGLARFYVKDGTGTIIWPHNQAHPDPNVNSFYGHTTADSGGFNVSFEALIPLSAGAHTLQIYFESAFSVVTTYFFDRSLRVLYTG
jgi:hypothetical protein